eukprot:TRINITY_DN218_c0_g2_i2.p1 TRINITY_DN218_c0_g2~~TRINITY_DN218_c0_g2_i2.p1  ORF type:complete len:315 (+),score=10.03 TRINITY_DN218_c0_g2_i2:127-1071(+)
MSEQRRGSGDKSFPVRTPNGSGTCFLVCGDPPQDEVLSVEAQVREAIREHHELVENPAAGQALVYDEAVLFGQMTDPTNWEPDHRDGGTHLWLVSNRHVFTPQCTTSGIEVRFGHHWVRFDNPNIQAPPNADVAAIPITMKCHGGKLKVLLANVPETQRPVIMESASLSTNVTVHGYPAYDSDSRDCPPLRIVPGGIISRAEHYYEVQAQAAVWGASGSLVTAVGRDGLTTSTYEAPVGILSGGVFLEDRCPVRVLQFDEDGNCTPMTLPAGVQVAAAMDTGVRRVWTWACVLAAVFQNVAPPEEGFFLHCVHF